LPFIQIYFFLKNVQYLKQNDFELGVNFHWFITNVGRYAKYWIFRQKKFCSILFQSQWIVILPRGVSNRVKNNSWGCPCLARIWERSCKWVKGHILAHNCINITGNNTGLWRRITIFCVANMSLKSHIPSLWIFFGASI
jgi:hypothetical protein